MRYLCATGVNLARYRGFEPLVQDRQSRVLAINTNTPNFLVGPRGIEPCISTSHLRPLESTVAPARLATARRNESHIQFWQVRRESNPMHKVWNLAPVLPDYAYAPILFAILWPEIHHKHYPYLFVGSHQAGGIVDYPDDVCHLQQVR